MGVGVVNSWDFWSRSRPKYFQEGDLGLVSILELQILVQGLLTSSSRCSHTAHVGKDVLKGPGQHGLGA